MTTKTRYRLRNAFAKTSTKALRKTFHERELKLFLREQKAKKEEQEQRSVYAPISAEAVTDFCV